jgi:hypothetical protein
VGLVNVVYAEEVAVPPPVVTVILPAVNPDGVSAVIDVALTTEYDAAFTPLNCT